MIGRGLYLDDELVWQDHNLDGDLVAKAIADRSGMTFTVVHPDQDWLEDVGRLPGELRKVKVSR